MKLRTELIFTAAALMGILQTASAADITGKITLKGTPPPEAPLPLDASCGKTRSDKPSTRFYVVDPSGGLADVFVYIKEGLGDKKFPAPAQPMELDQKGCEYLPYVLGLQAGQKLLVKNSDPLLHNVHPMPTVSGNPESNKAQLQGSKPLEYVFNNPEVFLKYKCDVHNWMFAYVGVVSHPFFAVSQKDGTFKIANVPPGKYVIEAVHRKTHPAGKGITKEVTVANDAQKLDFTIELPAK
jgi:hypothetical protein